MTMSIFHTNRSVREEYKYAVQKNKDFSTHWTGFRPISFVAICCGCDFSTRLRWEIYFTPIRRVSEKFTFLGRKPEKKLDFLSIHRISALCIDLI